MHVNAWRKSVLCAFNRTGECTVYPVRPTVCARPCARDKQQLRRHGGRNAQRATFRPARQLRRAYADLDARNALRDAWHARPPEALPHAVHALAPAVIMGAPRWAPRGVPMYNRAVSNWGKRNERTCLFVRVVGGGLRSGPGEWKAARGTSSPSSGASSSGQNVSTAQASQPASKHALGEFVRLPSRLRSLKRRAARASMTSEGLAPSARVDAGAAVQGAQ